MREAPPERQHRPDDRQRARVAAEPFDERAVELDLVEGKAPERVERRIAGAEIVQRHVDAERLDLLDDLQRAVLVLDDRRFGQLQLQPLRLEPLLEQDPPDQARQAPLRELHPREVHRDLVAGLPARGVPAGAAEHPFPQRQDEAVRLGQRDELGRRDAAALGMVPAQERLVAADAAGRDRGLHLVVQLQLVVGDGVAKVVDERAAVADGVAHLGVVEADVLAGGARFGAVHRQVGVAHQRVAVVAVAAGAPPRRCWRRPPPRSRRGAAAAASAPRAPRRRARGPPRSRTWPPRRTRRRRGAPRSRARRRSRAAARPPRRGPCRRTRGRRCR